MRRSRLDTEVDLIADGKSISTARPFPSRQPHARHYPPLAQRPHRDAAESVGDPPPVRCNCSLKVPVVGWTAMVRFAPFGCQFDVRDTQE